MCEQHTRTSFWEVAVETHRFRCDFSPFSPRGLDPLTRPEPPLSFADIGCGSL